MYLYLEFSGKKCFKSFVVVKRNQHAQKKKNTNFSKWHAAFTFDLNTHKHMQARSIHSSSASAQAIIVSPLQGHPLLGKWPIREM